MASLVNLLETIFTISVLVSFANATGLSNSFYSRTCPNLQNIVRDVMIRAVKNETRIGASILRLHFHDCFVNGCDASVLLDDTATSIGEKNAIPNQGSLRGFEVIDTIKTKVEAACPNIVSCADILALAAQYGVSMLGGPTWEGPLGRRDARTASITAANIQIPAPFFSLPILIAMFAAKGLSARDMTALSGAHTIGQAQCFNFRSRIYKDTNIDTNFAITRKADCPIFGRDKNSAILDLETPIDFDNKYYDNLIAKRGLLHSDQELYKNGSQDSLVRAYSKNNTVFFHDFVDAMIKMGKINPLIGRDGEIRKNCRLVN